MTVSSTNTKNSYSGDGSTTVFAYTFKIFDDDDITVILRTDATGTETVQTKTTHYSVSGVGNAGGGNITFVSAPASGVTVVLLRETVQTQTTDYTPNDPFPAADHEDALDKLTLIVQDIQEETDRSIKLSRTNTMTSTEFTVGASDRASKVLAFDTSGELSVTQELGTFRGNWSASTAFAERDLIKDTTNNNIYLANTAHTSSGSLPISTNTDSAKWDLIVDAASATTSATNAASSATAAASSATAAAASASAAATSETNAAASEAGVAADAAAAAASASSASTSATNAATSETNAATSASAASTSATNAATSATSASNSATSASTSASNAATSETNASNSASAASTSASNAATSETNAATSETNAASSASSAASDASAAAASAAAAAASFDAFDDIYLGAKASAPTVDNDGDALTAGDQYFNTTNNTLYVWNGSAWQAATPDIVADTTPQLGGNLDTNGNDITFGDGDKAIFGAGSDLEIGHTGLASDIKEKGTGNLRIWGDDIQFFNTAGTKYHAQMISSGAVTLYYNGSAKLATTSGGIDVTGTVTADGLTVDASNPTLQLTGGNVSLDFVSHAGTQNAESRIYAPRRNTSDSSSYFFIQTNDATSTRNSLFINGGTNDVSLYDSSGVTQGFFWDASTQGLSLRTTSNPNNSPLYIRCATDDNIRIQQETHASIQAVNDAASAFTELKLDGSSLLLNSQSGGNVGIGTAAPAGLLDVHNASGDANMYITTGTTTSSTSLLFGDSLNNLRGRVQYDHSNDSMRLYTAASERARIDSSGNLLVSKTSVDESVNGVMSLATGRLYATATSASPLNLRLNTSDGDLVLFKKDATVVGRIGYASSDIFYIGDGDTFLSFYAPGDAVLPRGTGGAQRDNAIDLGNASNRFDDIYATNGTIQTSDANEKQDIEALSDAEQRVAVAAKGLLRKYRWKSSVEEKGDDARIHFGIIAQDLKAAFEAEGLDAGRYAMFINSEWTDEETGEQRSRMGVRYNQLLAFIIAAI